MVVVGACTCVYVHMRTIGVVFSAQPRWADVMLGSGPCLCSFFGSSQSSKKVDGHLKPLAAQGPLCYHIEDPCFTCIDYNLIGMLQKLTEQAAPPLNNWG